MANNNHFNLNIDTAAPTNGSIYFSSAYAKQNAAIVCCSATNASYMKIWPSTSASSTEPADSSVPWRAYSTTAQTTEFSASASTTYYYNVVFKDSLGNKTAVISTNSASGTGKSKTCIYDLTNPTGTLTLIGNIKVGDTSTTSSSYTKTAAIKFSATWSDPGTPPSGVKRIDISGDCTTVAITDATSIASGSASNQDLTLTSGDGEKTINMLVTDNSDRTVTVTKKITLDTSITNPAVGLAKTADDGGGSIKGGYTNKTAFVATFTSTTQYANLSKYKIWGTATQASEPSGWTDVPSGTTNTFTVTSEFSATNGSKTIYIKVQDVAGNETSANASTTLDTVAPTATLAITGKYGAYTNSSTAVKVKATVTEATTSVKTWNWQLKKVGATSYVNNYSNTATEISISVADLKGSATSSGVAYIKLTITDQAGNSSTTSEYAIYYDIAAPVISSAPSLLSWYNSSNKGRAESFTVTDTGTAQSGLAKIIAWVDQSDSYTETPAQATTTYGCSPKTVALTGASSTTTIAPDITKAKETSGTTNINYFHACVEDNVGNVVYLSDGASTPKARVYKVDSSAPSTTAPQIIVANDLNPSKTMSDIAVVSKISATDNSVTLSFNATDSGSGMSKMVIYGSGCKTDDSSAWQDYSSSATVAVTNGEGVKQITVKFRDLAGNETIAYTKNIEIDASTPSLSADPTFYGKTADGSYVIPTYSYVKTQEFKLNVKISDDFVGGVTLTVYGDVALTNTATTPIAEWELNVTVPSCPTNGIFIGANSDSTALAQSTALSSVNPLYLTKGDGLKTVYVKVKDNAGHTSIAKFIGIDLDTGIPTVAITSYNGDMSNIDELRHKTATTFETYKDYEIYFKFKPSEAIQAWKAVAYASTTTAAAGSAADAAIPHAHAVKSGESASMTHESGLTSTSVVEKTGHIFYDDMKAAFSNTLPDGTYIIVVYVQDFAGTWSVAAQF